jgi:hypothetical protein
VARRAHGDAQAEFPAILQGPMAQADLQGFLGDQEVIGG